MPDQGDIEEPVQIDDAFTKSRELKSEEKLSRKPSTVQATTSRQLTDPATSLKTGMKSFGKAVLSKTNMTILNVAT